MEGTTLGAYRILSKLGAGGMGTVYLGSVWDRAPELEPGTLVAVKVLHPHLVERPGFFKRLLREARIGMEIRHPNVVRTLDVDAAVHDGRQHNFMVMEYVRGQTLRSLADEMGRVPEQLCRHVAKEVCRGLAAIHGAGVIHRDIKPENVLVTEDHVVKVMDLGLARVQGEAYRLSETGQFVGSLLYASPEDLCKRDTPVDARADLHAVGLVLYELVTGAHPFSDDDFRVVIQRIRETEAPRAGSVNPLLSSFLDETIQVLLAKDPARRFGSADELLRALEDGERSAWWMERARALRSRVRSSRSAPRFARDTHLYGRDVEMDALARLYSRAAAGQGQVVLVEGEAGIGKTRLVEEFAASLEARGEDFHFLVGGFPPSGAATAAGAFVAAFREFFGAEQLEESLAKHLAATPSLVPAFAALLTEGAVPRGDEPLSKETLHTLFVNATRSISADRPTVLVIDDLNFAPDEGLALFVALALAIGRQRVLLIGCARPGLPQSWISELERVTRAARLHLARLSPKEIRGLLAEAFSSDGLAEELGWRIGLKSDGNPFFVLEIIRTLQTGNSIARREDGRWERVGVIDDVRVPSTVLDLIRARVADLAEEDRELLEVASCCGFEFDPSLVAEATEVPALQALKRFGRIEKTFRLIRSTGRRYSFDHHQVQEALYSGLFAQLRERYHESLGEVIERSAAAGRPPLDGAVAAELCGHFIRGGAAKRALPYAQAALRHLESSHRRDAEAAMCSSLLAEPGLFLDEARCDVLLRHSECLGTLGRRADERKALDEADQISRELGDGGRRSFQVARALAVHLWHVGEYAPARGILSDLVARARAAGDRRAEGTALGTLGLVFHYTGHAEEARRNFERHLEMARETGDARGETVAMGNLGLVCLGTGRYDEARRCLEQCLGRARELGFRHVEASTTGNLGLVFLSIGRVGDALSNFTRHLAVSREIGDRQGEAIAMGNVGNVCYVLGRTDQAQRDTEQLLVLARELRSPRLEGHALLQLATLAEEAGRRTEARRLIEEGLAIRRSIGSRIAVVESLIDLGALLGRAGETQAACKALEEALATAGELQVADARVLAYSHLAFLAPTRRPAAEKALAEYASTLRHMTRMEAHLLLGRAGGGREHLDEADALLRQLCGNAPPEDRRFLVERVRTHREIMAGRAGDEAIVP